jgi:hypothetical protein
MKQGDTWFVTFGPHRSDESAESKARSTRTFKSEVDAKLFAMQILAKGWTASAGTLNPHQPKQVVGPSQIEAWADPGIGGCGSSRVPDAARHEMTRRRAGTRLRNIWTPEQQRTTPRRAARCAASGERKSRS